MVKHRNVIMIPILFIITFGIYGLYWLYSTAVEMIRLNELEEDAAVYLIFALIPFVNLYAIWKHAHLVERMTDGRINGVVVFLLWFIPFAGMIVTQLQLNQRAGEAA